ncbi:MAG: hypothetical protein IPM88_20810 [Nitrospira sp.]|nr:hypothetical protein [Nitrospira sp.]
MGLGTRTADSLVLKVIGLGGGLLLLITRVISAGTWSIDSGAGVLPR